MSMAVLYKIPFEAYGAEGGAQGRPFTLDLTVGFAVKEVIPGSEGPQLVVLEPGKGEKVAIEFSVVGCGVEFDQEQWEYLSTFVAVKEVVDMEALDVQKVPVPHVLVKRKPGAAHKKA